MASDPAIAKSIFLQAVEKHEPADWNAFLDEACLESPELRTEVEVLLGAHAKAGDFLKHGAVIPAPVVDQPIAEQPGDTIGPYKLVEQIGEGGFGVVFLAEQTKPLRREVALKVVKAGMDTNEVIARFEAERQALAMMDHPNIAKVLGAGATESGRPYFVMELVPGIPITDYCDQCKLITRERLDLFVSVCQAVQHAHQKGVIHRDLKPSNVLIAMQGGFPTPKIIDFGVAKAINQRLTEHTLKTRFAQILGTPLYMSPEQAELSPLGTDTRSDIYSLGVLLYELMTGTTPFDKDRLHSASFDELRQIIRDEEPPRPSTRLSTLAADLAATIADRHRTEVRQLMQTMRGDLDWIVMKAMEKDRTRRYDTANSLARDVERYLHDEPVEACPPSTAYRIHKFIRRNKAAITMMAVVAAALVVGAGVATWQAVRATAERDRAIAAEEVAGAEAARSEQVAQFLKDMLAAAGPSVARGRDATLLREVLEGTAERVERDLADQPEIQGDMWFTLGSTYQDIGDHSKAVATFERAVNCFRVAPGKANAQAGLDMARLVGDQEALALCLFNRAGASKHWGMGSDEAVPFLTECLELYREMGDRPLDEASCIQSLAACEIGDDHGESLARQAHEMFREHLGPDHHKTVGAQWVLGQILLLQGKAADAEPLLRQTLEMYENIYDKDHPKNQVVRRKLAACLTLQGNRDEANEILKGAPQATEPLEVMYCLYYHNVVDQLAKQERYQEAVPILDEMRNKYDGVQSKFGPDHRITKLYQNALAKLYAMTGQQEEARKWYDEADGETDTNGAREEQIQQIRTDVSRLLGIEDAELPSSVPGD